VTWVVDASVAAKWLFEEELTSNARALIGLDRPLIAPDLVFAEVGNVAWKRVVRDEISAEHARATVLALPQLLSLTVPTIGLLSHALEIAITFEHPIYDCMYLALAEQREADLVTADTRMLERLAEAGWVGSAVSLAEITP